MSIHTGFTGIRGFSAPFVGYALFAEIGARGAAQIGSTLVLVSILMFAFLVKHPRFA